MTRLLCLIGALLLSTTQATAADEHRAELFVGGGVALAGPNFYVTIYSDGRVKVKQAGMPIVPPGKLTESAQTFQWTRLRPKLC